MPSVVLQTTLSSSRSKAGRNSSTQPMLTSARQYVAVGVKLIVLPLIMYAICSLIPMEADHRLALYIISCVPVGNVVLSFSEILGSGQDTAANVVLLSTLLSVITIPLMLLII